MSVFKALKFIVILIAVDSSSNLGILIDYLKGFGFIVLETNSGEDALKVVGYLKPDVILLDVKLPGIDGFETCRQLKANQFIKNVPVIFMTTETGVIDKMHGFALGAVDYITKPIQTEELLARLRTHLTIQHLQSELEAQNERLQQEIAEREKLIEELDAFAHTVAHDLKDPLGVTVNYAQFIKGYHSRMSPDDLEQYSDKIIKNGQKMSSIIEELLLLSSVRIERVTSEPIDMAPIIEEAQSRLTHMIEEARAEVMTPDEWPLAWGYAPWIEEVWTNYISNAIKYGGTPPLIQLGATISKDNTVKFWVKDNGPGLTLEAQAQLFVPFSRPTRKTNIKGHGLGLSIVQRIVERLGGSVGVESNGHGGSVFSFSLPFYSGVQKQEE